ncbi:MAG: heme exporter protein CcmD [Porticoccaceae bacterium]|jgi:heme exporter protein D|nr:heme exporter protein CcmD [Porticoccaceae bacterium]
MLDAIQFSSFAEFVDMGGYGFNVWSVYALFAIFVAVNLILPLRKKQKIIRQLKRRLTLDAEIQSEDDSNSDQAQ